MLLSIPAVEDFLASLPGILVFHGSVLFYTLIAGLILAVKKPRWEWARGLFLASAILTLQILSLTGDWISLEWNASSLSVILANIDRVVELLSILIVCWFFLFPRRNRSSDLLTSILAFIFFLGGVLSSVWLYFYPSGGAYNGNILSFAWDSLRWIVLLVALALLLVRRPARWGLSLATLLILFSGATLQVMIGNGNSNLPCIARLFELLAYPLVGMRLALSAVSGSTIVSGGSLAQRARQTGAESLPQLSDLVLTMEEQDLPEAIAPWICNSMQVEVSLILAASEEGNNLHFITGFDRVDSRTIPSFILSSDAVPQLYFAVTSKEMLRLEKHDADGMFRAVAEQSRLPQAGPALYVPFNLPAGEPGKGLLLLAAYSGEVWHDEDTVIARGYAQLSTDFYLQIRARDSIHREMESSLQEEAGIAGENERLQIQCMTLSTQLQQAEQEWRKERERSEGLAALVQEQEAGLAEGRPSPLPADKSESLQQELEKARSELSDALRDSERLQAALSATEPLRQENLRLQNELLMAQARSGPEAIPAEPASGAELEEMRAALAESESRHQQEVARLQDELRKSLTDYAHLQSALLQPGPHPETVQELVPGKDVSMVESLISEIRQPFSSMVGYTDLLLSESAGILGAMQRKFLDRIRASITRTEGLFEDLMQLLLLPEKATAPRMLPVDVAGIIDAAITAVSEEIREKNIVLRLDVTEDMPPLEIDRDAFQQILNHLIQNAVWITPADKEIVLTAHFSIGEQNTLQALLLTVKDSGPGIPPEDQPAVFTRLYRTEGPSVEGLGDSGVGMAVARTLTEAMGGRIWLESQLGQGTTFFVLLPVQAGVNPESQPA
jgi:signal transduction histidine kinase